MTTQYVVTKTVKAEPISAQEYAKLRQTRLSPAAVAAVDGYLVDEDGQQSWSPKPVFEAAYVEVGDVDHLEPHQQRVVAESKQLEDRLNKLQIFLRTDLYAGLPEEDRELLKMQADAMALYLGIINTRVAKFS